MADTLKNLSQFIRFDMEAFLDGKELVVTGVGKWTDYDTKKELGTKVTCVIAEDKTPYIRKDGGSVSNRFKELDFKVTKEVKPSVDDKIMPVDAVGTVYGDYRNKLSVTCKDIKVLKK